MGRRDLLRPSRAHSSPISSIEAAVLVPARVDLDVQEQVDLAAEMLGDCFARRLRRSPCSRAAALAEHDRLLAVALDQDLLVDRRSSRPCGPPISRSRPRCIGQLGVELEVELLAGQLGGDHAVGGVGDLVLGEMPRALRASLRPARP